MTEAEWLECCRPWTMMDALPDWPSDRKVRLLGCAFCRRWIAHFPNENGLRVIDLSEQFADGLIEPEILDRAIRVFAEAEEAFKRTPGGGITRAVTEALLGLRAEFDRGYVAAGTMAAARATATGGDWRVFRVPGGMPLPQLNDETMRLAFAGEDAERVVQAALLRDIFGNPFRPISFDPAWLTSTAVALARGIYDDRAFDRMPILADALQDAGCDNADVLNHCRDEKATHVRGCWVVDLVLGKE